MMSFEEQPPTGIALKCELLGNLKYETVVYNEVLFDYLVS